MVHRIARAIVFATLVAGLPSVSYASPNIDSKISLDFTNCPLLSSAEGTFTYEKACIQQVYDNHPMTKTAFPAWQEVIQKPIEQRFVVPTEEMLQYMRLDNLIWEFPYENIKAATDPALISAAQKALSQLPPEMSKYINDHFYGFMLVSGVGWTGFASSILETQGVSLKPGAVIIINADNILDRNLNEWLAFREQTAFNFFANNNDPKYRYELKMRYQARGKKSTLEDNLRHFLIHETAHLIVNAAPEIHPGFRYRGQPVPYSEFEKYSKSGEQLNQAFPFLNFSWILTPEDSANNYLLSRNVPKALQPILNAKKIKFYSTDESSKFDVQEAKKLYQGLNKTCFPSLYAMVDYSEDFAESVTHYFMSHRESNKYQVDLYRVTKSTGARKRMARFQDDLWSDPACRGKVEFLKQLFSH